jgi:hypothetical protein
VAVWIGNKRYDTETGTHDVAIVIDEGAYVRLSAAGWPDGARVEVRVIHDGTVRGRTYVASDGSVTFGHLDGDRRYLVVSDGVDGWMIFERDLAPSTEIVHSRLVRAGEIRGKAPPGARVAVDALDAHTTADNDGTFLLDAIPPGTWKLAARESGSPDVTIDARPGDVVDLRAR